MAGARIYDLRSHRVRQHIERIVWVDCGDDRRYRYAVVEDVETGGLTIYLNMAWLLDLLAPALLAV